MHQGQECFCARCGAILQRKVVYGHERPYCPRCGYVVYYNPKLVAVGILVNDGKVLLVRRGMNPGRGLWGMPGGYVDMGEVVEEAVAREVWEETGLKTQARRLVGLHSEAGLPQVLAVYEMETLSGDVTPGEEVMDAAFFPLDELPPMAFPRDLKLLAPYVQRRE